MKHQQAERLMDRAFAEGLGAKRMAALRAHLDTCDRCRGRYDRIALAGRVARAAALGDPLAAAQLDRPRLEQLGAELLDSLPAAGPRKAMARGWLGAWAGAAAAAGVLVVVGVSVLQQPGGETITARGGEAAQGRDEKVALRAFVVHAAADLRELSADRAEPVSRRTAIKVAYSNLDPAVAFLSVVAVDARGQLAWLFPAQGGGAPIAVQAESTPLPGQARLGDALAPGPVRLFALFSERPLSPAEVAAAASQLGNGQLAAAVRLPGLGGVLQHSLRAELRPDEDDGVTP